MRLNPENPPLIFSNEAYTEVDVHVGKPPKNLNHLNSSGKLSVSNSSPDIVDSNQKQ